MKVNVKFPGNQNQVYELDITPHTTVAGLRQAVVDIKNQYKVFVKDDSELEKIWIEEVVLHFGEVKLEDNFSLHHYRIHEGCNITFSISPLPRVQVSPFDNQHYRKLKFIPGKTTFGDLRKEINLFIGGMGKADTDKREFTYNDQNLEDAQVLDDSYKDKKIEMKLIGRVKTSKPLDEDHAKDNSSNYARKALLSFLGIMFISSSSIAYSGWRYRSEISSVSTNRAKSAALISLFTVGMAICAVLCESEGGPGRSQR